MKNWYKIVGSKKYHCFKRQSRIYPFEYITACDKYIKIELIHQRSRTTRLNEEKKCPVCKNS